MCGEGEGWALGVPGSSLRVCTPFPKQTMGRYILRRAAALLEEGPDRLSCGQGRMTPAASP